MTPNKINVICTSPTYSCGEYIPVYHVGKIYTAKYIYDKIVVEDNIVEFEWMVYLEKEHNHYQFTDEDFNKYFKDIVKERDRKISSILNI